MSIEKLKYSDLEDFPEFKSRAAKNDCYFQFQSSASADKFLWFKKDLKELNDNRKIIEFVELPGKTESNFVMYTNSRGFCNRGKILLPICSKGLDSLTD